MTGLVEGLTVAGIVGISQGLIEAIKWLAGKYLKGQEKKVDKEEEHGEKLGEQLESLSKSMLEVRNDVRGQGIKQDSLITKVKNLELKMGEREEKVNERIDVSEKGTRNLKEAVRKISDTCFDHVNKDLRINEILDQK